MKALGIKCQHGLVNPQALDGCVVWRMSNGHERHVLVVLAKTEDVAFSTNRSVDSLCERSLKSIVRKPQQLQARRRRSRSLSIDAETSTAASRASETQTGTMTSRVPLLVKNKGRKPTRLPIAPKAKPTNVVRTKRTPAEDDAALEKPSATTDSQESTPSQPEKRDEPSENVPTENVAPPRVSTTPTATSAAVPVRKPTPVVVTPRGIAPGESIAARNTPLILPVHRNVDQVSARAERLSKMSTTPPSLRAPAGPSKTRVSPVLGPRAGGIVPQANLTRHENDANSGSLTNRMIRKLDIKPHQSPRRAAQHHIQQQQLQRHATPVTASPLSLAGEPTTTVVPELDIAKPAATQSDEQVVKPAKKKAVKRRTPEASSKSTDDSTNQRRSRRKVKKPNSYRDENDSEEEDDDHDEDVDPTELELPEEQPQIYVPARERATLWAKSVLRQQEEENNGQGPTQKTETPTRRKRSNSTLSLASNTSRKSARASKVDELLKKEPSQMTMGELALTIPKGRRLTRHEQEVNATSADNPLNGSQSTGGSNLINTHALNRARSLSLSSESAAFGGSLVTPQVEIIDGKMVVLESTIKIADHVAHRDNEDGFVHDGIVPRHHGPRYSVMSNGPGKRWGKDETKQFYYCLSQVGPNFSMMATLFPNRKRKELKCKFKYEEKHHAQLIEIALKAAAAPLDTEIVDVISQMVENESKKKEAKKNKRNAKQQPLQVDSPALSSIVPTPPPPQAEFLDDYDDYYRERKDSFDFAG